MPNEGSPVNSEKLYFVGLVPQSPISESIVEIKQYFASAYQSKAALRSPPHVTLQPPFKWDETTEMRLSSELKTFSLKQKPFDLTLDGFGVFPPKVIFVKRFLLGLSFYSFYCFK